MKILLHMLFLSLALLVLGAQVALADNPEVVGVVQGTGMATFEYVEFGTWGDGEPELWIGVNVPSNGYVIVSFNGIYAYVLGSENTLELPESEDLCRCSKYMRMVCVCGNNCSFMDDGETVSGKCTIGYR